MEELIFFAIIIFFSIIDAIARSRKKKQQGTAPPAEIPSESEWELEAELPTYDAEPRYDHPWSYDDRAEEPSPPAPVRASSEAMIPSDIWEEIAGLAEGRKRQLEAPAQKMPPPPSRIERPAPALRAAKHRVHRAHREYGTDPSSRRPSEQDGLDPLAETLSADAAAVRRQLRSGGTHALRRAVILQEILGPPAATKPDRFDD